MGEQKVYLFRIEVRGLRGSRMFKEIKKTGAVNGAFVNCVVSAGTKSEAELKLNKALTEDKYQLVKVDKIEDFVSLRFDEKNPEDNEYLQMAKDALKNNEVYYGEFCTWEKNKKVMGSK